MKTEEQLIIELGRIESVRKYIAGMVKNEEIELRSCVTIATALNIRKSQIEWVLGYIER